MRSKRAKKRVINPDSLLGNRLVQRLINRVMKSGKKRIAEGHVYKAFEIVKQELKQDPLVVFRQAVENIKPATEVRPRRVGGAAYQVPMAVRGDRRESLAIRWLVQGAQSLSSSDYHTFSEKLAAELINTYRNQGAAVAKKENVQRIAEANKAFAHFRW